MQIIGICGLIGSGKGAASDILVQEFGFEKVSFADSLKDCVSAVFGWDRPLLEGDTIESRNFRELVDPFWSKKMGKEITPRYILQKVGTEAMRDTIHGNIWIDSLERKLKADGKYVIPDVRFKNELEFIQSLNGEFFEIQRGPLPEWWGAAWIQNNFCMPYMTQKYPDIHLSEWDWIGRSGGKNHHTIKNDGTLEDLKSQILAIIN